MQLCRNVRNNYLWRNIKNTIMPKISKILIANRGEIAMRVMRSAKEAGIKTVAVFSDADRTSPHVKFADEAIHIGASPSSESYLVKEKIINACKLTGADAIHPGYGFLSENAEFAKNVTDAGIIFIGPKPKAIQMMGDKLAAKYAVKKFNIPMIPGTNKAVKDTNKALIIAADIGYPILIKAAAGGGGKGMRIVEKESEFEEQMNRAVSEAKSAFGNGSVFIERYIKSPRHIEIQIMADKHGNIVHLFERECSIQRRHQKVIEEAPSAILTPKLREKMGQTAIDVARACEYTGAGTVEFLLDSDNKYYFLEMNTRLQVEHPVTEFITGIDLVREQIKVAEGNELSFKQEDLKINGHAIELRVYAEDPENNFLPDTGTLLRYRRPEGPGVRVDDGFEEGMEIPVYYDPMISKLTAYGRNRNEAIERMIRLTQDYNISGVKNTLAFGRFVMKHEAFKSGKYDTHFLKEYYNPKDNTEGTPKTNKEELAAITAAWLLSKTSADNNNSANKSQDTFSEWRRNRS